MRTGTKIFTATCLAGALSLMSGGSMLANQTYTYSGNSFDDGVQFDISFTTSLTSGQLDGLATDTDITGSLTAFSFTTPPPSADNGGFPVADPSYEPGPDTVAIGTDALGNITSWSIAGPNLFASYPAFPGENPNDFFCVFSLNSSNSADSVGLVTDNDAGFCPTLSTSDVGTWSPIFTAPTPPPPSSPEPASYLVLGTGLLGLYVALSSRRRRQLTD